MTLNIKYLRIGVAIMALALVAMVLGRLVIGDQQLKARCTGVMDAQGHGPDEGSDEWWGACYHQMLVGTWVKPIEEQDGEEGYIFNPDLTLAFYNIHSMTGDRWEFVDGLNLRIWSHTERYPDPESSDYEIFSITNEQLVLKLVDGEDPVFYRKLVVSK